MKVRFIVYEGESIDTSIEEKCQYICGEEGDWVDNEYYSGWEKFEVEVEKLSDIITWADDQAYEAEATEDCRVGNEWIPCVTVWNPLQ